jgi:hypothetical protein
MPESTDWSAWSRDAVALMQDRNRDWIARFELEKAPYHWDLEHATITFTRPGDRAVVADICVVGTTESNGTFRWAWANDALPAVALAQPDRVREFGRSHDLGLLTDAEWPGGRAEGLEMLAVAGRILGAEGAWVDTSGDLTLFFLLFNLHAVPAE